MDRLSNRERHIAAIRNQLWMVRHYRRTIQRHLQDAALEALRPILREALEELTVRDLLYALDEGMRPQEYEPPF